MLGVGVRGWAEMLSTLQVGPWGLDWLTPGMAVKLLTSNHCILPRPPTPPPPPHPAGRVEKASLPGY